MTGPQACHGWFTVGGFRAAFAPFLPIREDGHNFHI